MTDPDGDNIWTITIPLAAGSHQYKFSYDNWTGQEDFLAGAPCTFTENGFTNRLIDVTDNVVLNAVCWGSCEACVTSVAETLSSTVGIYPNPATDQTTLQWNGVQDNLKIYNAQGQLVMDKKLTFNTQQLTLETADWSKGMYTVVMMNTQGESQALQLVVR